MTVYKAIKPEAEDAAKAAVALASGQEARRARPPSPRACPSTLLDPGGRHQGQRQGHRRQGRLLRSDSPRSAAATSRLQPARSSGQRPRAADDPASSWTGRGRDMTATSPRGRPTPSCRCGASPSGSAPCRRSRTSTSTSTPARWWRSSATTARASPRWSRSSPGSTARTRATMTFDGRPVRVIQPRRGPAPRHRDRVPGPRAVRQPRRRRATSSWAGSSGPPGPRRGRDGAASPGSCCASCPPRSPRSASPSPASRAGSGRPSRSPARCSVSPRSSSWTSRPPRSASPRPPRCSTSSSGCVSAASASS